MGSQTTHGFPYPVGTDRVMDGDNAMQALAEAVDAAFTSRPRAKIVAAANQTLNNDTITTVTFAGGVVSYDTNGMADLANNRLVIKTAGLYVIHGRLGFAFNAAGARGGLLWLNGATYLAEDYRLAIAVNYGTVFNVVSEPIALAVNDNLSLRALQVAGGTLPLTTINGRYSHLAAYMVSY